MFNRPPCCSAGIRGRSGFTLVEVVVCVAILAMVFGAIVTTYFQSVYCDEFDSYNLSAHALALQPIEQAKSVGEAPPAT